MRIHRNILAAALALAAAFNTADAQRIRGFVQSRAWLGISYDGVLRPGRERPLLVIRDVVDGSPAERAGLMKGDTILRVNDINATDAIMASLGSALSPGDEVRVRVLRSGGERELVVTAAERPERYGFAEPRGHIVFVNPDSVRGRLNMLMDSVRMRLDSLDLPGIYVDSGVIEGPDRRLRLFLMPRDSLTVYGGRFFHDDSIRMRIDTVWSRMMPFVQRYQFRGDTVFGWHADSTWRALERVPFRFDSDSVFPDARAFQYRAYPGLGIISLRAIAGAELTDLSEGLGEYFGVDEGVLVVRVPEGTPAHRSGLEEGDVIVRANDRTVTNTAQLRSAFAGRRGQPVKLEVIRKKNRVTVELSRE